MELKFTQELIIYTISQVTGIPPENIQTEEAITLTTRDWEQLFSRLEAALDLQINLLTSINRSFSVNELTHKVAYLHKKTNRIHGI